jgi:hypothetical protein
MFHSPVELNDSILSKKKKGDVSALLLYYASSFPVNTASKKHMG